MSALVPRWGPEGISSGASEGDRPVLIALEPLGASLRGRILSMSSTHAEIRPEDSCFLFSKVSAQVRFRCSDTLYTLTGSAVSCEARRTIVLDFDKATRANIAMMRNLGMAPAGETGKAYPCEKKTETSKRTKEEQKKVMHIPPPDGVERRLEPRFDLDSDASLHILNTGHVMPCALLEISRSGCRLFSETPFELESETRVEVEFTGNGYPFRIGAMIRPKSDEHITGLQFVELSPRRRAQLDDLVNELRVRKAPSVSG